MNASFSVLFGNKLYTVLSFARVPFGSVCENSKKNFEQFLSIFGQPFMIQLSIYFPKAPQRCLGFFTGVSSISCALSVLFCLFLTVRCCDCLLRDCECGTLLGARNVVGF